MRTILLLAIFATGLRAANPVDYAKKIKEILDKRASTVVEKIKDQQGRYDGTARISSESARDQLVQALEIEAGQRARALAIDYRTNHKSPENWRRDLSPFLRLAQEKTFALLLADLDDAERFLGGFDELRADVEKTEALARLVDALAKKRNLKEELNRWFEYGNETKDEFTKLACKEVGGALTAKKAAKTAAEADLKKLQAGGGAPAAIAAAQANVQALDQDIKTLEAWTKEKGCK